MQCWSKAVCAEAWTQRASRSPCSLRPGSPSPWHDGCLCLSVCQVCKEQGRNSGSQHGRSNHEHERSSLSSAVAKEVAKGVVHVGQRQEHVKRAGTRMRARAPLQPTEPWCASRRRVCNTWQLEGSDLDMQARQGLQPLRSG